jgi:hypothetical protein
MVDDKKLFFSPQDIVSKHNSNNQQDAPVILQFLKALKNGLNSHYSF